MMELRGTQDNLVVALNGGNWTEMLADLASQLERARGTASHVGAHVWLDAADCPPSMAELEQLVWLLEMHDMKLEWWKETDKNGKHTKAWVETESTLMAKAETVPSETRLDEQVESSPPHQEQNLLSEAALVPRTLRSGQTVRYAGTVVVFGDVNPGAVVVAEGNVIVWGKLRGVVHAGAAGDARAVVGALELAPSQLRIGGHVARAPDANRGLSGGAEQATVRNGSIVIEDWDDGKV
jgi:septum site-determining protein MinC